jgi:hypothetical protein
LSYLLVPELPDDPEPEDPDVPELLPVPPLLLEPLPVPPELLPEPEVPEPEVPLELEPLPPILEPLPVPPVALLFVFVFFFELLLPEPAEPLEPLPVAPLPLELLPLAPLLPDVPLEPVFWAKPCAARNAAAAMIKPSRFILLCCLLVLARRIKPGGLLFVRCAWAHQAARAPPSSPQRRLREIAVSTSSSACYISHAGNSSQVLLADVTATPDRRLAYASTIHHRAMSNCSRRNQWDARVSPRWWKNLFP